MKLKYFHKAPARQTEVSALARSYGRVRDEAQLRIGAAEAIGTLGAVDLVEPLIRATESQDTATAVAAAASLQTLDHLKSEPVLIGLLKRPDSMVRSVAAKALGRMGTSSAIGPLLESSRGLLVSRRFKQLARKSAQAIMSRTEGVRNGQLSLRSTESGQLGLATEGGQLNVLDTDTSDGT